MFKAAVKVSRLLSKGVKAAVDVKVNILEINTTIEVKVVRFCRRFCAFEPLSRRLSRLRYYY
jgi:hypothetical protein